MNRIKLRPWQRAGLDSFRHRSKPDWLCVATPGAGKTTFANAARHLYGENRRLVVVTPTSHLKTQWAAAAARFGVHLNTEWVPTEGLHPEFSGIVTTYAHIGNPEVALHMAREAHGAFVVLDEIHHAADRRTWGESVRVAFEHAWVRLGLSGTPFRSDDATIPFIDYTDGEAQADFVYGYGEALADGGVVRPVDFPAVGGEFSWRYDGVDFAASFDDALDRAGTSARLRSALSLDGEWLPTVLGEADARLQVMRRADPTAGGLVIAMDVAHAKAVAERLGALTGRTPTVVTSDDPAASKRIGKFATSADPWIVAVKMISEGVDIPRLRVGVYATNVTAELFFRQAVGRVVRWRADLPADQDAVMFIPDDPRLRQVAVEFAEHRMHVVKLREAEEELAEELDDLEQVLAEFEDADEIPEVEPQGSLFEVLSAEAGASTTHRPATWAQPAAEVDDGDLVIELPPIPANLVPVVLKRQTLRQSNQEAAVKIAGITSLAIATVNAELNRLAAIRGGVAQASSAQLVRRLEHAEQWLSRLGR